MNDTPSTDSDHPDSDATQRVQFEGRTVCVIAPEDLESIEKQRNALSRDLAARDVRVAKLEAEKYTLFDLAYPPCPECGCEDRNDSDMTLKCECPADLTEYRALARVKELEATIAQLQTELAAENAKQAGSKMIAELMVERDSLKLERDEAQQWIDSEPDWKAQFIAMHEATKKELFKATSEVEQLRKDGEIALAAMRNEAHKHQRTAIAIRQISGTSALKCECELCRLLRELDAAISQGEEQG